jgi:hypothetical protein
MNLTLEEQERRAYADGDLAKAEILAAALDVIDTLSEQIEACGHSTQELKDRE